MYLRHFINKMAAQSDILVDFKKNQIKIDA